MNSLQAGKYHLGKVVKANSLVEAKYDLNLMEQKILSFAISKIDPISSNNYVKIKVKEICSFLGTTHKRYDEIRNILIKLRKRDIIITQYDQKGDIERELIAGWINNVEYDSGLIEIEFPNKLMPYFVELKERYTMYDLSNICHISGKFSLRIYELLKENEYKKSVIFDYEKMKEIMCLEDKFNRYYDFKKNVLLPAQAELEQLTDIRFEYEEIKIGRNVHALEFKIYKNKEVIETRNKDFVENKRLDYYGDKDPRIIFEKYRAKTIDELVDELHSLIEHKYNEDFDKIELASYSHKSLMRVIFGIIDGEYKDVKKPRSYFKTVLSSSPQE